MPESCHNLLLKVSALVASALAQANLSGSLDFGPPQATTPRENFRNDSLAACVDEQHHCFSLKNRPILST